jgi:hypothetical protein
MNSEVMIEGPFKNPIKKVWAGHDGSVSHFTINNSDGDIIYKPDFKRDGNSRKEPPQEVWICRRDSRMNIPIGALIPKKKLHPKFRLKDQFD